MPVLTFSNCFACLAPLLRGLLVDSALNWPLSTALDGASTSRRIHALHRIPGLMIWWRGGFA